MSDPDKWSNTCNSDGLMEKLLACIICPEIIKDVNFTEEQKKRMKEILDKAKKEFNSSSDAPWIQIVPPVVYDYLNEKGKI